MEKRLFNVEEAAIYLGICPKTLYNKVSEKKVPYVKIGRSLRFDKKRMDEMIKEESIEPHPIY